MSAHIPSSMNAVRRTLLMSAAVAVIAGPLTVGYLQAAPAAFPEPVALAREYVGRAFRPAMLPADLKVRPTYAKTVVEPALAQTASRVSGVVTDQRGAAIADAMVTVTQPTPGTNPVPKHVMTDATGRYDLDLIPGEYTLVVVKPGFKLSNGRIFVNRESPISRDFQLAIGSVTESIMVSAPPVDPTKKPTDYLDMAKAAYEQGNLGDAERLMSMAIARLRGETAARAGSSTATARTVPPPTSAAAANAVRIGGDIKEPKKIADVKPIYPPEAMAAGVTGIVILEAIIGQDGSVIDARVLRGQPLLNQAALDAVTQWRFTPTTLNGAPVDVMMTVTVNFSLQ